MTDYTRRAATESSQQAYAGALRWLFSLVDLERQPMTSAMQGQMALARPAQLLTLAGQPQDRYRTILVAGSKGKGSTAAMLAAILQAAGYRTGFYSKPHLHTYRERIRVDGVLISPDDFSAEVERFQPLARQLAGTHPDLGMPTTFEVTTAIALDYFAARQVDVAVVEVGLGGRLDATNVVNANLSIITPISYEHTAVLGDTLAKIATEKAGIIKPNRPVLSAPQSPDALAVLKHVAELRDAPLGLCGIDWSWTGSTSDFSIMAAGHRPGLWQEAWHHSHLHLSLLGAHQVENAATSVAAAIVLTGQGLAIDHDAIVRGLAAVRWPGRLEVVRPADAEFPAIVLDGAHNRDSAERLAAGLRENFNPKYIWVILGVYGDKDLRGIIEPLEAMSLGVYTVRTRQPRCRSAEEVADQLMEWRIPAQPAADTRDAIVQALGVASPDEPIVVTGSLSIVAEAREALGIVPEDERDPLF